MKKLNSFLNGFIGCLIGALIARSIFDYWNFKTNTDLYATNSNTWYNGILVHGISVAVILVVVLVIKFFVRKNTKE